MTTIRYCFIGFFLCISLIACTPGEEPGEAPVAADDDRIDLIVKGDHIVSMDAAGTVIEDGAIAVDEGVILAIGKAADIEAEYSAINTLKGGNRVVMPGLVNGHTHAAMTLLRGVADDLALMEWLQNYIFPAEVEFVDAEFVRIGTELACWEMIRGGTTTIVDMYYYPDTIAEVIDSCGLRALISATVIDQRSPDAEANYTLDADQLQATRAAAQKYGAPISIHVSESQFEVQNSQNLYGMTSIEMLESIDFFDGPTIAAHVIWPTEQEIPILAERKVGVVHNPTSNMKLASGIAPIAEMLDAGVRVGLGTDGAASNNDLDMWEEMRLAAFLQKIGLMNPEALPATAVLRMATSGGAEAIGLGDEIGSLEVGKRADIIQVAFDDVHHIPTFDLVSHLVYVSDEQDVASVVVDGKVLMQDGDVLTIDTARVRSEATALASRIQAALAARNQE
jgi:5-methylthioadenosine/S-adenosylhomocysteine deaminase